MSHNRLYFWITELNLFRNRSESNGSNFETSKIDLVFPPRSWEVSFFQNQRVQRWPPCFLTRFLLISLLRWFFPLSFSFSVHKWLDLLFLVKIRQKKCLSVCLATSVLKYRTTSQIYSSPWSLLTTITTYHLVLFDSYYYYKKIFPI